MTLKDIKPGMVVEDSYGTLGFVTRDRLNVIQIVWPMLNSNLTADKLAEYNMDLTNSTLTQPAIDAVYIDDNNNMAICLNAVIKNNLLDLTCIWQRQKPTEEMTLDEVCEALGKNIKIVR